MLHEHKSALDRDENVCGTAIAPLGRVVSFRILSPDFRPGLRSFAPSELVCGVLYLPQFLSTGSPHAHKSSSTATTERLAPVRRELRHVSLVDPRN
jgi:hypothetical protein